MLKWFACFVVSAAACVHAGCCESIALFSIHQSGKATREGAVVKVVKVALFTTCILKLVMWITWL